MHINDLEKILKNSEFYLYMEMYCIVLYIFYYSLISDYHKNTFQKGY